MNNLSAENLLAKKELKASRKILYIIQLPPPLHGVSKINEQVFNSDLINQNLIKFLIKLQFAENLQSIGRWSFKKIARFLHVLGLLFKIAKTEQPDAFYFTMNSVGKSFYRDALIAILLKFFKKKIILHLHGKGIYEKSKNSVNKWVYERVFNNSHVIFVSKQLMLTEFQRLNLKNCNCYQVENGIEIIAPPNYTSPVISSPTINLLFLSALMPTKGIFILLEAINILKEKYKTIHLDVIGSALDQSILLEIKKFINKYSLSELVTLHGAIYDDSKYYFYQTADIFIHPTLNESFGLVILEAMQFAKPVISTFEGSIPDIVQDNKTGLLVEKSNSAALAEKIAFLIENPETRVKMGLRGRERFLDHFTQNHFEHRLATVFNNILK